MALSKLAKITLAVIIFTIVVFVSDIIYLKENPERQFQDPRITSLFDTLKVVGVILSIVLIATTLYRRGRQVNMGDYTYLV